MMQISNNVASLFSLTQKRAPSLVESLAGGNTDTQPTQPTTVQDSVSVSVSPAKPKVSDAEKIFLDYMKKSPAERMQDAWLASHHLTKKDLEAMSPEQRKTIEKQMADEIQQQLKQTAANKPHAKTDILV